MSHNPRRGTFNLHLVDSRQRSVTVVKENSNQVRSCRILATYRLKAANKKREERRPSLSVNGGYLFMLDSWR
jgi:hypothetical protein